MRAVYLDNPALVGKFLAALIEAEAFDGPNPDAAIAAVADAVALKRDGLAAIWPDYVYASASMIGCSARSSSMRAWRLDSGNHPPNATMPGFTKVLALEPRCAASRPEPRLRSRPTMRSGWTGTPCDGNPLVSMLSIPAVSRGENGRSVRQVRVLSTSCLFPPPSAVVAVVVLASDQEADSSVARSAGAGLYRDGRGVRCLVPSTGRACLAF